MSERWRHTTRWILPLVIVTLLGLALLMRMPPTPTVHTTTRLMMGTMVTITLYHANPAEADLAIQHAFAEMARVEKGMSSHQTTSEVSQINGVSRETWHPVSTELGQLLQKGIKISTLSHGAFAMGLKPLTTLWGFSSDQTIEKPPATAALQAWLEAYPTEEAISVKTGGEHPFQVHLKNASVGLDLGAIAKGYAIDQGIAILRQKGIHHAIVDAGGDMRVIGNKGGKPWRIGIQDPRQPDQVVAVSHLEGDMAMVTSGDYERFFISDGVRYHHILDPKTAKPAQSGVISLSVQAPDATTADALATALFVLGAEKGMALLAHFPKSAALLITEEGKPVRSPGFVGEWLGK